VATCASCGRESPDDFGFCPSCGNALATASRSREVRKVVTILFCDLIGSTALGDRTDPETLRLLMRRYYETARAILERHGGTVEKFVGDAVMAVFGIPLSTEEDALRAVRAAVELRDTVHELGLDARIGVNTGDVVAGEGDTLVTGDAVNVAARLEQGAGAGEILLGADTLRLVRDAVETQQLQLQLKGKPDPLPVYRLTSLEQSAAGIRRRLDRPLVGRRRELARLRAEFDEAVAARTSRLFTLIGPAGVGKSRLVADLLASIGDDATVARGRALSYGEGITYWPLIEMLLQLGIPPDQGIRSSPADTQLATRALLERVAEERPLVLVLDDLQWAQPPMFDLVEHLVDWVRDTPMLLLCIARPELLDARPGWGGGKLNATSILLEPLPQADATALADSLLADLDLTAEARTRIIDRADGNPLFLEEMAGLVRDLPAIDGELHVPPTIHAVLQARLDALSEHERTVIERGAVEGRIFHRGSVTALAPPSNREQVPADLLALMRKEMVRPDRSQFPGDDAFRFRHLLIRDTAYESLPKAVRGDLHERFAEWLDAHADLVEQDEFVGYHLERAASYLAEMGTEPSRQRDVARRAADRLARAAERAYERHDAGSAASLQSRAAALVTGDERRRLLPLLIEALQQVGAADRIPDLLTELDAGSDVDRAVALALNTLLDPLTVGRQVDELRTALAHARSTLVEADEQLAVIRCDVALGILEWFAGRADLARVAYERALDALLARDQPGRALEIAPSLMAAMVFSGEHTGTLTKMIDRLRRELHDDLGPLALAGLDALGAPAAYISGELGPDEIGHRMRRHAELLEQTGSHLSAAVAVGFLTNAAWIEGDLPEYRRLARRQAETGERLGMGTMMVNAIALHALALSRSGSPNEALAEVARARAMGRTDDVADQVNLDLAEAHARASLGERAAAMHLVDTAEQRLAGLVMVPLLAEVRFVRAEVLAAGGDLAAAREQAEAVARNAEARGQWRLAQHHRAAFASHG
jgi:class 3 adenylate cyclase